jgi:hypothetical protein
MLPDMGFVRMIPRNLDMFKSIERAVEAPPEIKVLQRRVRFQRRISLRRAKRLEAGFADKRGPVAGGLEVLGYASAAGIFFGLSIFAVSLLLGWVVKLANARGGK